MSANREKMCRLYTTVSRQFIERFLSLRPGAVRLRSKEPAAAWNADGRVGYVTASPWQPLGSPPHHVLGLPPLLVVIQANTYPPPGLFYAVRSKAFRASIGVRVDMRLAEAPVVEVVVAPEELLQYADWLVDWEVGQATRRAYAPCPPTALNTTESNYDFTGEDGRWLAYENLWTRVASEQAGCWYEGVQSGLESVALVV